ncbi:TLCD1 protein, partial [Polypterus senegalus]|nr:TLC domain-containing protein 1 [Polypterus senegalus]MBN3292161.1 TLCD1 protein [Polypterus senegalus]
MEAALTIFQNYPTLSILVWALLFRGLHRLLRELPLPRCVVQDRIKTWRWRNLSVSLVHSIVTGPGALCCVFLKPDMLVDIMLSFSHAAYLLVCVSSGYFIQDAADIIISGQSQASWEFLVHHALVISSFLYTIYTHRYVAGSVLALFVEMNSIFLHSRLLLKLANAQTSDLYRVNKYVNLATYVLFRLGAQFYITWYILYNFNTLVHPSFFLVALMLMNLMILVYFYRLLRTDFLRPPKSRIVLNGTNNNLKFVDD